MFANGIPTSQPKSRLDKVNPMANSKFTANENEWQPLPAGTLNELASRLKTQRRLRLASQFGGVACVVIAAIGLSLFSASRTASMKEPNFGGITCTEVRRVMMDLAANPPAPDVEQRVQEHLRQCPACQKFMQGMQTMSNASTVQHAASCPICLQRQKPSIPARSTPTSEMLVSSAR